MLGLRYMIPNKKGQSGKDQGFKYLSYGKLNWDWSEIFYIGDVFTLEDRCDEARLQTWRKNSQKQKPVHKKSGAEQEYINNTSI